MENDVDLMIGAKLIIFRVTRGLDVATLASAVGCSADRVSAIERGAHVSAPEMMALCRVLEIVPQDLLDGITADKPVRRAASGSSAVADGLRLNAAFVRLPPKHRAFLIDFAEQLAEGSEPDDFASMN